MSLHDCLVKQQWLSRAPDADAYDLTRRGVAAVEGLGIDVGATRALRRRFAFPCVDWSERRPHLGGGLAALAYEHLYLRGLEVPPAGTVESEIAEPAVGEEAL